MQKIKLVLIVGLSNGKIVYEYFSKNKNCEVVLLITYPDDCNKPRHMDIGYNTKHKTIITYAANDYVAEIIEANVDFIFVAGWSELLNEKILSASKNGVIGFHPSRLPNDRGRSVLAWQIEDGYTETALSMFYYGDIPDNGDIIAQENIKINELDYINDVLDKVDRATYNLLRAYFPLLKNGKAPRIKQNNNEGNFRRLRTEIDSLIDWDQPAKVIINKVRAISHPYPGAITELSNSKYKVWKVEIVNEFSFGINTFPGTIVAKLYNNQLIIRSRDAFIKVIDYEEFI